MRIIKLILFIQVFTFYPAFSQVTISGKLIDEITGEPVVQAHILHQKRSIGTLSDAKGNFVLTLRDFSKDDDIVISHVTYETANIKVSSFEQRQVIALKTKVVVLEPVLIRPQKFDAAKFMQQVSNAYEKQKKKDPQIAIAHYREKAKYDDKYVFFMESIGYGMLMGERRDNTAALASYKFFCDNTRESLPADAWLQFRSNVGPQPRTKVFNASGSTLNEFGMFELSGPLSKKNNKKYKYELADIYELNKQVVYSISFSSADRSGVIDVLKENLQIIKAEYSTRSYISSVFWKRIKADIKIQFNYFEGIPYLSAVETYYNRDGLEHFNSYTVLAQKFNEFDLDQQAFWSFNDWDMNPFIDYRPEEWEVYNIPAEPMWDKIKADLSTAEYSLAEQFKLNSGKWYMEEGRKNPRARITIQELQSAF
ncbi:MAG TPA: carboxypeptidase-like regulatory domain-containing protein [Cyclobacteriaceae bacterium]|nr:carboxypeptidase-like regulatory domain-containing protein [Cyclobacteriaceae bacterium]